MLILQSSATIPELLVSVIVLVVYQKTIVNFGAVWTTYSGIVIFFFFFFVVSGIGPRASLVLGK